MIYRTAPRYRWYLRFWAAVAAAIVVLAAVNPTAWIDDWRYRVGLAICFALLSLYLVSQDYILARQIETDDRCIHFRRPSGHVTSVPWDHVQEVVNHASFGYLYLSTHAGAKLTIDHHVENAHGLVREIVSRTGVAVREI